MKKKIFWLASYPRSGNRWMRTMLSYLFFTEKAKKFPKKALYATPDMHQFKQEDDIYQASEFSWKGERVSLVKTHNYNLPYQENDNIETVGFIYLYRHPLDMVMSAINYFIVQNQLATLEISNDSSKVLTIDDLKASGELNSYIDNWIKDDLTIKPWQTMSKNWIEHTSNWINMSKTMENTVVIKYGDLLENTFKEMTKLKDVFEIDDNQIKEAIAYVPQHQNMIKTPLVWKKQSKNYENYLDKEQILLFNSKYGEILEKFSL